MHRTATRHSPPPQGLTGTVPTAPRGVGDRAGTNPAGTGRAPGRSGTAATRSDTTWTGNKVPVCAFQDFWQDGTGFGSAEQSVVGDGMCPCTPRPHSGSDA